MQNILLVVLLSLFSLHSSSQNGDAAPYLYYYSHSVNALIVERADGTDQHVIGKDLISADGGYTQIEWSPSGKWSMWRSESSSFRIISADGQERISAFDALKTVYLGLAEWSPQEDLLFLAEDRFGSYTFYLFNASNQSLITTFSLDGSRTEYYRSHARWTSDGKHILFYYSRSDFNNPEKQTDEYFLRTVSTDGTFFDVEVGQLYESIWRVVPEISPKNDVIYLASDKKQWVVENLTTRKKYLFSQDQRIKYVEWNRTGDHALIIDNLNTLWLLNLQRQSLIRVHDAVEFYETVRQKMWSNQGAQAVYIRYKTAYLVDGVTGESQKLAPADVVISASWSNDDQTILINTIRDNTSASYLIDGNTRRLLFNLPVVMNWVYKQAVPSPDNRYFALFTYPQQSIFLIDLYQQKSITFPAHPETAPDQAYSGTHYQNWSEDSQWLINGAVVFYAGGGNGPRASSVMKIDGTYKRDLTFAFVEVKWLPEAVIPYLDGAKLED
jgi:hypothetical protein